MDEHLPVPPTTEPAPKRPRLLMILCVLTFAGSGLNIFSGLVIASFFTTFQTIIQQLAEKFDLPGMEILLSAPPSFFFISALIYGGSGTGAVLMWRLRKTGFHVYTISQILLLIAPMYFLKMPGPSILDLLLSGLFIILYSTQLKSMR